MEERLKAIQESHVSHIEALTASHFHALAEVQDAYSISLEGLRIQHRVELEGMVDSYFHSNEASVLPVTTTREPHSRVARLTRRVQFALYRYRRARRALDNRNIRYMALVAKIRNLAAQDASSTSQFDDDGAATSD